MSKPLMFPRVASILSDNSRLSDEMLYNELFLWTYEDDRPEESAFRIAAARISEWRSGRATIPQSILRKWSDDALELRQEYVCCTRLKYKFDSIEKVGVLLVAQAQMDLLLSVERRRALNELVDAGSYGVVISRVMSMALNNELICSIVTIPTPLLGGLAKIRRECLRRDTPLKTPHILLSLLSKEKSLLKDALDMQNKGLGDEYEQKMASYVSQGSAGGYSAAKIERLDFAVIAKLLAYADGERVAAENHIIMGVLMSDSRTINEMRRELGDKYDALLNYLKYHKNVVGGTTTAK